MCEKEGERGEGSDGRRGEEREESVHALQLADVVKAQVSVLRLTQRSAASEGHRATSGERFAQQEIRTSRSSSRARFLRYGTRAKFSFGVCGRIDHSPRSQRPAMAA